MKIKLTLAILTAAILAPILVKAVTSSTLSDSIVKAYGAANPSPPRNSY